MKNVPTHVAIIMDGNGRWARGKGLARLYGHKKGLEVAELIIDHALKVGVKYLSLFVFSTENWKRPVAEVNNLFSLADKYLSRFENFCKDKVRVVVSGERDGLPVKLVKRIDYIEQQTKEFDAICVNLCINYGGQKEIVEAVKKLNAGGMEITAENILRNMYHDLPEPDIILRTGGQKRLSNFLMFQSAYSELFFTDTLWPDFTSDEFDSVLADYCNRSRNFGGLNGSK